MGACSSKPKTVEYEGLMSADSKFDDFGTKSANADRKNADVDSGRMMDDANIPAANKSSERSLQTLFVKDVLPDSEKAQKQSNDGTYEEKSLDKLANQTVSLEEQRPEDFSGVAEARDLDKPLNEIRDIINVEKPHEPANETASLEEQLPRDGSVVVEAKESRNESQVPPTISERDVDLLATEGTTIVKTLEDPSLNHQTSFTNSKTEKISATVETYTPDLPLDKEGSDQAPPETKDGTLSAKIEQPESEGTVEDELPGLKSQAGAESAQPDESLASVQETPGIAGVIGRAPAFVGGVIKAGEGESVNEAAPAEGFRQTSDVFYETSEREAHDQFDGMKPAMTSGVQSTVQIVSDTCDLASEKAVQLEESSHDSTHDAKLQLQEQDAYLTQPAPEFPSSTVLPEERTSDEEKHFGAVPTVTLEQSEQQEKKIADAVAGLAGDQLLPIKTPDQPLSSDTSSADFSITDLALPGASVTREMLSTELSEKEVAAEAPVDEEYPEKMLDTVVQSIVEPGVETKVASDTSPMIEFVGKEAATTDATNFTERAPSLIEEVSGSAVREETEPLHVIPELKLKPEVEYLSSIDATQAAVSLADSSNPRSIDVQPISPGADKAFAIVAAHETSHIINDEMHRESEVTNAAVLDLSPPVKELLASEPGSDSDLVARIAEQTQLQVQPEEESKELEILRSLEDHAAQEIPEALAAESVMSSTESVEAEGTIATQEKSLPLNPRVVESNELAFSTGEQGMVKMNTDSEDSTDTVMASVKKETSQLNMITQIQSKESSTSIPNEPPLPSAGEGRIVNVITGESNESAIAAAAVTEESSSQVDTINVIRCEESSTRIPNEVVNAPTRSVLQMEEGGLTTVGTETEELERQFKPLEVSSMVSTKALEEKTHQAEQSTDGEEIPEGVCTSAHDAFQSESSVDSTPEQGKELTLLKAPVEEADDSKSMHESIVTLGSLSLMNMEASGGKLAGNKESIEKNTSLAEKSEKHEIESPAVAEAYPASSQPERNIMIELVSNTQVAEQATDIDKGFENLASEQKGQASVEIGDNSTPIAHADIKDPLEESIVS